ncbi:DUF1798 family protein [Bacillus sp. SCS-151]|uniref:DUF1798 family protein n=1 Tax=Nanhaiella sioensis TaxID=3115293 RepID=UPI00397B74FF
MENYEKLIKLTNMLKTFNNKCIDILEQRKELTHVEVDFYREVYPFANEVNKILDMWKINALQWINEQNPKYIYPMQIESTIENLQTLSVQVFYNEGKGKRLLNLHQSVDYLLNAMISELKEK